MKRCGLGRLVAADPRDRKFLLKPLRDIEGLPERRNWNASGVLDQGGTPQCVAYSTAQWLASGPVTNRKQMPWSIAQFYRECQRNDEWPGEDYDGTSVRAAFKVLKRDGFVSGYEWAFDYGTALKHLMLVGPMVFGTDWYEGMFGPDAHGYVRPGGAIAGGHAYAVVGATRTKRDPLTGQLGAFRILNSWGAGWGQGGRAWLSFADANYLIAAQGEAVLGVEVKR